MTGQHTPGPWEVTYNRRLDMHTIRYVRPYYSRGESRGLLTILTSLDPAKDAANAALAAAAPELLAALCDLHDRLVDFLGTDCECDNTHEQNGTVCCLCSAAAAIAKARGAST